MKKKNNKKQRSRSVIVGALNYLNDVVIRALTTGFFAGVFAGGDKVDRLKEESITFGADPEAQTGKRRSVKRRLAKKYDESIVIRLIKKLSESTRSCRVNVFGTYLMVFGVYSLITFLITYYASAGVLDRYLFVDEAFVSSVLIALFSIPLLSSSRTLSVLFSESLVIRGFFSDTLGVSEEKFEPLKRVNGVGAYFVAVLLGIISGGLTYFVSPIMIIFTLVVIVIAAVIMSFPEVGVLLSIIFAPLAGFFSHPTVLIIGLVAVTLVSYAVKVMIGKRCISFRLTDLLVALFGIMLLFGGIVTAGGVESLASALIYVGFIAVYFLIVNLMNTGKWLEKCVDAIALSSAIVALFGILSYTEFAMPGGWIDSDMFSEISSRAISTFANPNMLATYLVLTAPFLWANVREKMAVKSGRIFALVGTILSFVCVILTWSRGGWLGYLAAVLVYLLINYRYTLKYLLVAAAATPIVYAFMPKSVLSRFLSIGSLTDSSTYYRLYTWKGSLKMLADHFMGGIGVGESAFHQIYPIYSYVGTEATVHSHNLFLEIAVELGVVGLLVFVLLMLGVARSGFYTLKNHSESTSAVAISAGLAGLAAALVHGMVDYIWYNYRVFFMFWVIAALVCAYSRLERTALDYEKTQSSDASTNEGTLNIIFRER